MRVWLRAAGGLVAGLIASAAWGAMPAGAGDRWVVHRRQSIRVATDRAEPGDSILVEQPVYSHYISPYVNSETVNDRSG